MNRWVVAGGAVVMQAGLGSFYSWSVFREPLSSLYGANITEVNVAFFLASFVFTIAAFGGGLLMRRAGPRAVGVGAVGVGTRAAPSGERLAELSELYSGPLSVPEARKRRERSHRQACAG